MSWTQGPVGLSGECRRKGHEKRLLWRHRREIRRSALANHSRATDCLNVVGKDRTVFPKNFFPACSPPIGPQGHAPCNTGWMGRVWTHLVTRQRSWHPTEAQGCLREGPRGVSPALDTKRRCPYKALGPCPQLRKVGYMRSALYGMFRVYNDLPGDTIAAWSNIAWSVPKHRCLELKSDLIGAHLEQAGRIPTCQF